MEPVLLLVRELGQGGSERQMVETARFLDRARFEPHVGCFRPGGLRRAELEAAGVPVARFPVISFRSPSAAAGAREMVRYVRRHAIRLVHAFDYPMNLFGVPVARMAGVPVVLASQRAHRRLSPAPARHLLRVTDRMATGVVVNCEYVRRHLIEEERVPPRLVHLCRNGIDTAVFRPGAEARPAALQGASLVVGTVAALRPEKGLDLLVEAFARVRGAERGMRLAIVGSGPCGAELEEQARRLGIAGACVFEPATAEVARWLRAMDIFVLPSLSEALSNSLMEAMACGCAAIASRVGGNPELVAHGDTGLLFAAGDAGALAEALERLAGDEAGRRRMGAAAAAFIAGGFTTAQAARRMGAIYGALLEGAGGAG